MLPNIKNVLFFIVSLLTVAKFVSSSSENLKSVPKVQSGTVVVTQRPPQVAQPPVNLESADEVNRENSETCAICLESGINFLTRCNHQFHKDCLAVWLKGQETAPCPLCRVNVTLNEKIESILCKCNRKEGNLNITDEELEDIFGVSMNEETFASIVLAMPDSNWKTATGISLLMLATYHGFEETVKKLIEEKKALVNDFDDDGRTPLMYAVLMGHLNIVEILLNNGADYTQRDNNEETALDHAIMHGYGKIAELLLSRDSAMTEEFRRNVNDLDEDGKTALENAVKEGQWQLVELLLKNGANPPSKDPNGSKLLFLAAKNSNLEIVKILVESYDADVNLRGKRDMTPLMYAAEAGNLDLVRYLVDHGADPNLKNNKGLLAWYLALNNGHREVADLLSEYLP